MEQPFYVCNRCNYRTNKRSNLKTHLNKATVCDDINNVSIESVREYYGFSAEKIDYVCTECEKSFSHKSNLVSHKKCCKNKPANEDNGYEVVPKSTLRYLTESINQLRNEIQQQRVVHAEPVQTNTNNIYGNKNNINNTNNHIDNHIDIHINNFGQENLDYLTSEFAMKCFEKGAYGIISMIDEIYFNDDHTENNNVRLRSINNKLVEVMKDKSWVTASLSDTIGKMIYISKGKILEHAGPIVTSELHENMEAHEKLHAIASPKHEMKNNIKEKMAATLYERRKVAQKPKNKAY